MAMGVMAVSPPTARLASRADLTLKLNTKTLKLLALDPRQLVSMDPICALRVLLLIWIQFFPLIFPGVHHAHGTAVPRISRIQVQQAVRLTSRATKTSFLSPQRINSVR